MRNFDAASAVVKARYSAVESSAPKRPWYRLHWLTWLVLVVVTGALAEEEAWITEHWLLRS